MSQKSPRPTKAERREQAREAARIQQEQAARRRSRRIGLSIVGAAVLVLVAVLIVVLTRSSGSGVAYDPDTDPSGTAAGTAAPSTAVGAAIPVSAAGVGVAPAEGDVVVSIYTDFMCTHCATFEEANEADRAALVEQDGVTVEYHLLAFMDDATPGAEYSTRAANAAAVVANQEPERFVAFYSALFANQPASGSQGLSDQEIGDLAGSVGVSDATVEQFTATDGENTWRTFSPWLQANRAAASEALEKVSTPTVLVDGEQISDVTTPGAVAEAVRAARG